jgi:aryl sulfotransferase
VPVAESPRRYVSEDEDSARWDGFPFRAGDIVISTRTKSGTTWMQMICALLVFGTPDLPRPLAELSPWLDHLIAPREEVFAQLAAQRHRRFIKTHTPLDGVPLDDRATYIVVARHPLDLAVSAYHQVANLDRERLRQLIAASESTTAPAPEPTTAPHARPPVRGWLVSWIGSRADPCEELDSLPGVMMHLSDAWARARRGAPNVVLIHYDDLRTDLDGQMRRLAARLGIDSPDRVWPDLVRAATFDSMKSNAERVAPNPLGVLKNNAAFFRRGRSGAGRELLSDDEYTAYLRRAAELAPPDLLSWLHR